MTHHKSILIIEDDEHVRNMLSALFTQAGYVVNAVVDGESALTVAESGGFNAIILDIQLPKVNGLEFLKQIRSLRPNKPNGPIIAFTSQTKEEVKKYALQNGAAAYLTKDETDITRLPQEVESIISGN